MLLQGAGINPHMAAGVVGGTLPHNSSLRKMLPTIPGCSTLQRSSKATHSGPPPSYDFYEEPTIYAQIDHYKTTTAQAQQAANNQNSYGACMGSPTSQGTPSTVSPGTVQMYTLPQHPGGYHTLPHNHHNQTAAQQPHNSASMMQMMAAATVVQSGSGSSAAGASSYHHGGTLPMPPSYQQHQQQQLQQQHGLMMVSSNSSGLASATTTAAVTSPSSSLSGLSAVGKSYSREIVTVRTPLMFSQQESCV